MNSTTDWDCPTDLEIGERVEVKCGLRPPEMMTVVCTRISWYGTYAVVDPGGGRFEHYLAYAYAGNGEYVWRRASPVTLRYPTYGARCSRCNDFNEYAENWPNFVCYGCRV